MKILALIAFGGENAMAWTISVLGGINDEWRNAS